MAQKSYPVSDRVYQQRVASSIFAQYIILLGLLDTHIGNGYNIPDAEVAQSVEQWTENPRVPSSILGLGT